MPCLASSLALVGGRCDTFPVNRSQNVFLCLAAAIVAYQSLLPPVVSIANNGDFPKVIGQFGIWPRYDDWAFANATFDIQPDHRWSGGFFSTETALVPAALALNGLFSKDGNSFDVRCIGIIHGALFLLALWVFASLLSDRPPAVQAAVYALILVMLCDVMYVGPLNAFYMERGGVRFSAAHGGHIPARFALATRSRFGIRSRFRAGDDGCQGAACSTWRVVRAVTISDPLDVFGLETARRGCRGVRADDCFGAYAMEERAAGIHARRLV